MDNMEISDEDFDNLMGIIIGFYETDEVVIPKKRKFSWLGMDKK